MTNYDLHTLNSRPISRNNFNVNINQWNDVFEFDIFGRRQIVRYLLDMRGVDADLRLYRDTNRNCVFDSRDTLVASSLRPRTLPDTIDYRATTGTYFAMVNRFSGRSISYDLDLSATYDLGVIGGGPRSRNNFSVTPSDPTDVFEFDIFGTRNINLSLHDVSFGDDVDLRLFRDTNRNGIFDASDRQVACFRLARNLFDLIYYRATSGTFFAQVVRFAPGSRGAATYDLDISATAPRIASNLLGEEVQLGNLSGDRLLRGGVNNRDTTDTYAFSLGLYEGVNIRLGGLRNDADIRLVRDRNNNGIADAGEVIGSSTRAGRNPDAITNINQSGNYFVQVYQFNGNTPYSLLMDHYRTPFA